MDTVYQAPTMCRGCKSLAIIGSFSLPRKEPVCCPRGPEGETEAQRWAGEGQLARSPAVRADWPEQGAGDAREALAPAPARAGVRRSHDPCSSQRPGATWDRPAHSGQWRRLPPPTAPEPSPSGGPPGERGRGRRMPSTHGWHVLSTAWPRLCGVRF